MSLRTFPLPGLVLSLALHALVLTHVMPGSRPTSPPTAALAPIVVALQPSPSPPPSAPKRSSQTTRPTPPAPAAPEAPAPLASAERAAPPHTPASRAAPPAPTQQEWDFASRYTLRNSKGYRHTWGQQVRSMMGTVVEGPDQGLVRFRVEIAPDGTLTRLETLWSTSPLAERLARQAIDSLPQWPPTPTGKPLVFERTIAFSPHAHDDPPLYHNDCRPEVPAFRNPYDQTRRPAPPPADADDPALDQEECLRQLPRDSIEAEVARDRRMMERWGWSSSQAGR